MAIKGNTTWKPAPLKRPMLENRLRPQLGTPLAAAVPILIRFGLPFVAWAGGAFLATKIISQTVPEIPFNKEKIGLSSALIGGGLTSYFLSESLPEDWRPISYALAVAGVAAGSYFLFTPAEKEEQRRTPSRVVPSGEVVPYYTPRPLMENFVVAIDPDQPDGLNRWPYSRQTYQALVTNYGRDPITFFVGASVYEEGSTRVYRSPQVDPIYGRTRWTVKPGKQEAVTVTIPPWSEWRQKPESSTALQFEFFRYQDDLEPFKVSEAVQIKYSFVPILEGSLHSNPARNQIRTVEFHNELDANHVIGCAKCKRKKKNGQQYGLPTVPLIHPDGRFL